jgi:acetylglutamate kinase
MKVPIGFRFAGAHAGLKPVRRDVALIVSDVPAVAAGCFTQNLAAAAPMLDARPRVPSASIRAVLVNSGNANAMTGPAGVADVVAIREAVAKAMPGVTAEQVLTASTGMIGVKLPASKVIGAVPGLVSSLTVVPEPAAEAILTTDTRTKLAWRQLEIGGREVTISAIAKGSGMIAPQLATMIAVVTTDAAISPAMLDKALRDAIDPSFHCLVVDGDMSTNDTIIALANGQAGNARIEAAGAELAAFSAALTSLCTELARDIASDGEGATRLLEVAVGGAPDVAIARDIARSIAASSLVKAAIFGADPNWGRVLATVGARAGSQHYAIDPHAATVTIQGVPVFARGEPALTDAPALRAKMRAPEVRVEVGLAAGPAAATAWGCDLGYDYVKLNADYTSLIVQTADGGLAKDDRLTNYSPSFKRKLIVEALSYISRFSGTRCVIKFGGTALSKPALEQAFCDDIKLLRSVGLQPIVVHGGSAEVTRTLEKLGHPTPEFVEGVRVTSPSDLKVVDMALGSINSHLVSLLNLDGAHALGISGKDGALFRAKKKKSLGGRDLGLVGEITQVNASVIEMLLGQGYVPVISPTALGEDGQGYNISADEAASAIATALKAQKLLYLIDAPGITEHGELVTDLTVADLERKLATADGGMAVKIGAMIAALRGGVGRVHVIDGRTPHNLIAELFTDRGVGTLVTLEGEASAATLGGAQ